jgi:hypothetical protein
VNKIVAHFQTDRVMKGVTADFLPTKDVFHLMPVDSAPGAKPAQVKVSDLKALFFVKDFDGNRDRQRSQEFTRPAVGRKIRVVFKDGEVLVGTTQGYQPGRPGFFVTPADAGANNERCYIVASAAKEVALL